MGCALVLHSLCAGRLPGLAALRPGALPCSLPHAPLSNPATVDLAGLDLTWVAVLLVAGGLSLALGAYAWRQRAPAGGRNFSLLMLAVAGWCLAYASVYVSRSLGAKLLWAQVEYLFIPAVPVLWLLFALRFAGHGRWLSRRTVAGLFVVPTLTVLLVWTNGAHHWFYLRTGLDTSGSWPDLVLEHGPFFWLHIAFSYLCLLVSTLLLGGALLRTSQIYRRQAAVLLAGSMVPWVGSMLALAGISPWPGRDLTPVAFTLSGLVLAVGLFRFRLLQVVPVARQAVVEGLPAAMIVLDADERIADLNPAAQTLFGVTEKEAVGLPARDVLRPAEIVLRFADVAEADTEITWDEGGRQRIYRVTISPLGTSTTGTAARLVLVWDVTAQAQARAALEQANRRLQALQRSTAALTAIREPAELFEQVMCQAESLMAFHSAVLATWDAAADRLTIVAHRCFDLDRRATAQGLEFQRRAEWVARHGAPLREEDAGAGPPAHSRSMLMAPLLYGGRCLGVLGVGSPERAAYSPAEQDLLLAFASQVATALENTRLYDREQARRRLADTLQEAGRTLSMSLAPDRVLALLMDQVGRVVDYQGAAAGLLRDHRLELLATRGCAEPASHPAPGLDVSENGIFLEMAATGRPVIIADVAQDPRWVSIAGVENAHAWIGVPLTIGERTIGQLAVYHAEPGHYGAEDGQALLGLARQAAAAIENARLHGEIKAWAAELEQRVETRTRELQAAQAQLLHAERLAALGRLSAGIAHEIGNPLGVIRGYFELMAEDEPDHPYMPVLRRSTERLIGLLAQLRDFSKPSVEIRSAVRINDVVEQVLALAWHELKQRRVEERQDLADGLPPIQADGRQLEQVFLNLVLNACDAMPEGGTLTVRTFCEADRIVAEVTDTGTGIPAENLERIFEPYFTTKEDKGTGLGLAICRTLVEAHGGQIAAESQVGVGTTFRVWLPIGEGAAQAAGE